MKVIFIVGPTAVGKSAFSQLAARELNGHILNADSLQFYQRLDIGTAKPTSIDRKDIPHHLFDIVPAGAAITAGDYRRLALETLERLSSNGLQNLFVVGGSGFYLQALERGMYDFGKVAPEIHSEVEQEAETQLATLFSEVSRVDPLYAEKIGPTDRYRIARAVELIRMFGQSPSQLRADFKPTKFPYPLLKIGLTMPRTLLLDRVRSRTMQMLNAGLVKEVQDLLPEVGPDWQPLQSVGYREVLLHLSGGLPGESLQEEIVKNTMRLAKRQMTWFRRDTDILWYEAQEGFDRPLHELRGRLRL